MQKNVLLVWLLVITLPNEIFSQSIIYGFPSVERSLKSGDVVIVNLPPHRDGRLPDSDQLLLITRLLNNHPNLQFRIELHIFFETPDFNLAYSERLARNLIEYLEAKAGQKNYKVIGLGSNSPIFLKEDDPIYLKMNTRLQILIN